MAEREEALERVTIEARAVRELETEFVPERRETVGKGSPAKGRPSNRSADATFLQQLRDQHPGETCEALFRAQLGPLGKKQTRHRYLEADLALKKPQPR
jgi:hypothetical protein